MIVFCQKLSQYGEKILYKFAYHIVSYLGNCEALHEITDLVHEMLSVCTPIDLNWEATTQGHLNWETILYRGTLTGKPLHRSVSLKKETLKGE